MRRAAILLAALMVATTGIAAPDPPFADVRPGGTLTFPEDEGAHPAFATEWWYVTGWLETERGARLGFQVTFFRTRPGVADLNPSAFAARQVLIAHAALSDLRRGRALHGERIAREGFGLADAASGATRVVLGDWRLEAAGEGFATRVAAEDFGFELELKRTQAPMLNGIGGYSQKGPAATSASRYYSLPQLSVHGRITEAGSGESVSGVAWLDHEWSSAYLDSDSVGWDWAGINLNDGGALMAFRIRDAAGGTRYAGGTRRAADGSVEVFGVPDIDFSAQRRWRSPRTGIEWPVAMRVRAGAESFELLPLFEDQESDSRATTGAVYWEGAVTATASGAGGGRGYLELTGYGAPLKLR